VANSFGPGGNVITIGDASGSANATLSGAGAVTFPPSISVASGNSGVATITSSAACTFSGAVTLNSHDLILSPAASALTLSGGVTGSGNLTLNSTGAGIITLSTTSVNNTGTITNSGAGAAANVISAVIGTNVTGVTESSSTSSLTLSGANTYAGETTLSSGTLNINSATAIGSGTFTITSGTINNTSGGAITLTNNNVQNWNGDFVFTGTRSLNLGTGAVTPNASRQVTVSANTLTVGGVIGGGAITLTKAGAGTLTLSGANTFTGGVTLNSGTLNINNTSALGDVTGTFTINGGTIDNTTGGTVTTVNYPLTLNADFTYSGSLARTLSLGAGTVTINADRQITVSAGTLTIGGAISASSINLTKVGTGTLSFGANTVTLNGLTISAGTLTSTSGTLSLAGDFSNNGTFTHNSGTVTLNGVAQAIGGSSISTFNNLTLGGTGAKAANIGINIADGLTVNQPLTMSGSNVLTMQSTASQPTFASLTEITGTMTWQAIGASAYTFNNAQTIVTFSGADAGRTFTLKSQPGVPPTGYSLGHTVNRDFNVSYTNWNTGTVTLQLAYLQAEASTLGVTESKLKGFDGGIAPVHKLTGSPTRQASGPAAFGYLSYSGLASSVLVAGEIALDDQFNQFYSVAATAWNVNSTWDAGLVPTSADDVVIANNFPVTIPDGYTAAALSVAINATSTGLTVGAGSSGVLNVGSGGLTNNSTGTGLTVRAGASVTITGANLTNNGAITNNGTITVQ
jgi:autotransporter-associated beta strand protein